MLLLHKVSLNYLPADPLQPVGLSTSVVQNPPDNMMDDPIPLALQTALGVCKHSACHKTPHLTMSYNVLCLKIGIMYTSFRCKKSWTPAACSCASKKPSLWTKSSIRSLDHISFNSDARRFLIMLELCSSSVNGALVCFRK